MSFSSRLKERRNHLKMSRADLANRIGVTASAIANYENNISTPKAELLYDIFEALKCDANYLFQDEIKIEYAFKTTLQEQEFIKKYRSLNERGKEMIHLLLERELENQKEIQVAKEEESRTITYYPHLNTSAKGEFIFSSVPNQTLQVPKNDLTIQADFAINVADDSMEPIFKHDDILLVKAQNQVQSGEIGVFIIQNQACVKIRQGCKLISYNNHYPDILLQEGQVILCVGKVVTKKGFYNNLPDLSDEDYNQIREQGIHTYQCKFGRFAAANGLDDNPESLARIDELKNFLESDAFQNGEE